MHPPQLEELRGEEYLKAYKELQLQLSPVEKATINRLIKTTTRDSKKHKTTREVKRIREGRKANEISYYNLVCDDDYVVREI